MAGVSRRNKLLIGVAALAVVAVVLALVAPWRFSGRGGEEEGSKRLAEALEKHPGLAKHRLPLAYVSEKLEEHGGEASREVTDGPAQEAYDARALPRQSVAEAQQDKAETAFQRARTRYGSATGKTTLRKAQGLGSAQSWSELGPTTGSVPGPVTYTGTPTVVSGRTTSLAIAPDCSAATCTVYAGTAGGGVWKTTNGLANKPIWKHIGDDIPSNAVGSVTLAGTTLYVGTGEPNGSSDSEAGVGLYKSTDAGRTFTHVDTSVGTKDFALNRSVAAVEVDPTDPQHLYVGTAVARHGSSSVNGGRYTPPGAATVGLYESSDGGASWKLSLSEQSDTVNPGSPTGDDFFRGGISKIQTDPGDPGTVYASMFDYGLYRRTGSGDWKRIYSIHNPGAAATSSTNRVEFAATKTPDGKTRVYLGDATYFKDQVSGLLRTDDARAANPSWTALSNATPGTPGYGSYNFCQTQCSYDMVVTTPPNKPDTVYLSGSMNYDELIAFGGPGSSNGRAVVRSTDEGVHVTDMTNDAQARPNGLHPDQHALAFVPNSPTEAFFTASDGGVVRQSGPFVDHSADCTARGLSGAELTDCEQYLSAIPTLNQQVNSGLASLQFQSVSLASGTVQGGTQDNGTWEGGAGRSWIESVGGDGGQSGFDADTSKIRFHSYFSPQHDVNFNGSDPLGWDFISDRLLDSQEAASFYTPLTADPVVGGTVFDGLQHVWRTTDNGGDRAFLDKYCNELTGDYAHRPQPCGDFEPLGGDDGDLSSAAWGNDSPGANNYVVAVERATSDRSTLWAGTRLGRLFVSTNADAKNAGDVTYQRIDRKLGLPTRFVSGISVDPSDPDHVFVSYSGYSAYAPGGHVYEINWDPANGTGTARDLSLDLGDQPITDIAYVPGTKALFVGTDFGVLTRAAGGDSWVATPGLPKVAVYGLTLDQQGSQLYAATHGRGVWRLRAG
ncbi:MAG: hypothetical protein J2P24_06670 [Streptosporangiales bacterium]|nr:hypothetical protein [Streptosporangiales bacterium]MBO0891261.1 hypothetical protein [Acidothermales bacterium]